MTGIYMIWFENDKLGHCYVGQSVNLEKRKIDHMCELRHGIHNNKYMQNTYLKYGEESMHFEILYECAEEKLNELEQYYIHELFCFSADYPTFGLNLTTGGQGSHHIIVSEKTKEKHSAAMKRVWSNEDAAKKRIEAINKANRTEESRAIKREQAKKMHQNPTYKERYLEFRRSDEFRKHMSDMYKGRKLPEETKQKMKNNPKTSRPVLCVELNKILPSIQEANRFVKETYGKNINVCAVLTGKRKTAADFHWEYYSQS